MGDLSVFGAIGGNGERRICTAHKKTGERCKATAMNGTNVCGAHGGRSPQVKRKARQRLEEAADRLARELLRMAEDTNLAPAVKLAALRDALDRAGLTAKQAHEVEVSLKPWEQVLAGIDDVETTTRAEARRRRGEFDPDDPGDVQPWTYENTSAETWRGTVVDAEIVEEPPACSGCGRVFPAELPAGLDAYPELCRDCRDCRETGDATTPAQQRAQPARQLISMEQAVAETAGARFAAARHANHPRRNFRPKRDTRGEFNG